MRLQSLAILLALLPAAGCKKSTPATPATATQTQTVQPLAAYAPQLVLTGIQMSQAESLAGGKSTYIDGRIENKGTSTVTALATQTLFATGDTAPQILSAPLTRIRAREPYIDTEPFSAAPLAPGATADFRLIFEDVSPSWNQQIPEIHVTAVTTR